MKMFIRSCGYAKQRVQTTTNAVASLPYKLGLYVGLSHLRQGEIFTTLTKQNTQGLMLYVGLSHLKTRKEIQPPPLQRDK